MPVVHDGGIWTREEQVLVSGVPPPHEVGRLTVGMTEFQHLTVTVVLAHVVALDDDPIPDLCLHRCSLPEWTLLDHDPARAGPAPGSEVTESPDPGPAAGPSGWTVGWNATTSLAGPDPEDSATSRITPDRSAGSRLPSSSDWGWKGLGMPRPERSPSAESLERATIVQTHISTLFFVGDRVFKLHKPVHFGFVDFREHEARRADCEREVTLNRRLAPDVYLGVADLVLDGVPLDHMVVMRRLPEDRRLTVIASGGRGLTDCLRRVAGALVAFHRSAARSPEISRAATGAALRAGWEANFLETDRFVGAVLDDIDEGEIRRSALRWVDGRGALLEARITAGRVCDGHGDLQADDIFCLDDGVRVLDCIEFSDRCATRTSAPTSPSWPWTSNDWGTRRRLVDSSSTTRSLPATGSPRRSCTTTWRRVPTSGPRCRVCGRTRAHPARRSWPAGSNGSHGTTCGVHG